MVLSVHKKCTLGMVVAVGLYATPAAAAEIKVALAEAVMPIVQGVQSAFEQISGHRLVLTAGSAGAVRDRVRDGEIVDVVFTTKPLVDELATLGKLATDSAVSVSSTGVGIMVKAGAPKPDVSTPEALKAALLAASSVAYGNPAGGSASVAHFVRVLDTLGISTEVSNKAVLVEVGSNPMVVPEAVISNRAELGYSVTSVIRTNPGVELAGELPGDLQSRIIYSAAIGASAEQPEAARAFLDFLLQSEAAAVIKSIGMDPAN